MSIRLQLWFYSSVMILTIIAIGGISIQKEQTLLEQLNNVSLTQMPAVRYMTLADMMHDGLRGVVFSAIVAAQNKDQEALKEAVGECDEKANDFEKYLNSLEALNIKSETKAAISEVRPSLESYIKSSKEIVKLAYDGNLKMAVSKTGEFESAFKSLEDRMESLGDLIMKDAFAIRDDGKDAAKIGVILTVCGVLLSLIFSIFILKGLVSKMVALINQLSSTSKELTSLSGSMNSASSNLSNSSNESAASLEQASASLEELTSMVRKTAQNANLIRQTSNENAKNAETGDSEILQFIESINEVNTNSKKMVEIINVIDDISFQTNLLALNAAVEAARAGEQGKGFAVVAEAVRNLAQRSAAAAKDINSIIKQNISQIQTCTNVAARSGTTLKNITTSVKSTASVIGEIQSALDQQVTGLNQVNKTINELDKMTQENARNSSEIAVSATTVLDQSDSLSDVVQIMKNQVLSQKSKLKDAA